MKIKNNILFLFLLGMTTVVAQTAKKPVAAKPTTTAAKPQTNNANEGVFAEIETSKGKIVIALEYKKTPITVANFISLAEGTNTEVKDEKLKGKPFYNGLKFHRVIADFMIQGGDPAGNGSGGPGYAFKDEIVADLKHNSGGILSMANSGPKTNGSQFFITHKETPWLDGKHTVFGEVVNPESQEVVNSITQNDMLHKVTIIRKGEDAKKFDAVKVFSNYFKKEAENRKKQQELSDAEKRKKLEKFKPAIDKKLSYFAEVKEKAISTSTGLKYTITHKSKGEKPKNGETIIIDYAGFLEDGTLFDTSNPEVAKTFGTFDELRAMQKDYTKIKYNFHCYW